LAKGLGRSHSDLRKTAEDPITKSVWKGFHSIMQDNEEGLLSWASPGGSWLLPQSGQETEEVYFINYLRGELDLQK